MNLYMLKISRALGKSTVQYAHRIKAGSEKDAIYYGLKQFATWFGKNERPEDWKVDEIITVREKL